MALGLIAKAITYPLRHYFQTATAVAADHFGNDGDIRKGITGAGKNLFEGGKEVVDGDFSDAGAELKEAGNSISNAWNNTGNNIVVRKERVTDAKETATELLQMKTQLENGDIGGLADNFMGNAKDWDLGGIAQKAAPWLMGIFAFFTGGGGLSGGIKGALTLAVASVALPMIMNAFGGNDSDHTLAGADRDNTQQPEIDANAIIDNFAAPS